MRIAMKIASGEARDKVIQFDLEHKDTFDPQRDSELTFDWLMTSMVNAGDRDDKLDAKETEIREKRGKMFSTMTCLIDALGGAVHVIDDIRDDLNA